MIKVKEKELKGILKKFINYPIKVIFNGVLTGEVKINNCFCKYVKRSGNIEIRDNNTQNILNIDTFLAYKILRDNCNITLELYMDYDLIIKIVKI